MNTENKTDIKNGDVLISVKGLQKSFGDIKVLQGIDINIHKGDVVVVVGPSGSGKSTFLRTLNLLEEPTGGEIYFKDENILEKKNIPAYRAKVEMVFQSFNLFDNMTVLKNCMIGQRKVLKVDKETARREAMFYLEKVGMAPYINAKPRQLTCSKILRKGKPLWFFWFAQDRPGNQLGFDRVKLPVWGRIENPVWVDMITGRVFEIPASLFDLEETRTVFRDLPMWDSPVLIADRSSVELGAATR